MSRVTSKMLRILLVVLIFSGPGAPLDSITRKTLGRTPPLGNFYDRRLDLILPDSLFQKALSKDEIRSDKTGYTFFSVHSSGSTFTEMAQDMGLSMEEKLSVALGITKATGSLSFLTGVLGKPLNPTGNACLRTGGSSQGFNFGNKKISQLVSLEALERTNATDVITSVSYGLETCYNFDPKTTPKDSPEDCRGNFTRCLSLVERSPDFVCRPDMIAQAPWIMSGDELNRKRSQLDFKSNSTVGDPVEFYLLPLSEVRKRLKVNRKPTILYHEVPKYLGQRVIETAEKLHKVKHEMATFWNQTLCQPSIIPDSKLSLIKSFVDSWFNNMTQSISKMAQVVTAYRIGSATYDNLTTAHTNLDRFLSDFAYSLVEWKIGRKFPFVSEYKHLAESFDSQGLKLISKTSAMNELIRENKTFNVLKYTLDWIQRNRTQWNELKSVLLNSEVDGNWVGYPDKYLLDCDILPQYCVNVTKMEVKIYEGSLSQKNALAGKYLAIASSILSSGLPRITNNSTMDELIRGNKTFVVLKFKLPWILENPDEWDQLRSIFMNYHKMWSWFGNPDKYLMDCDLLPEHCQYVNKMVVNRYNAGQLEGAGDYLCAISKSFLGLQERNPYGAFRASWYIDGPFKEPYKPCRTKRVLAKYQGVFWEHEFEIII